MDLLIGGDFSEQDKIDGMTPYQDMAFIGIAFVKLCQMLKTNPCEFIGQIEKAMNEVKEPDRTGHLYPEEDKFIMGRFMRRVGNEGFRNRTPGHVRPD